MKLTRVRVPEFRALKNIDITFEPDFVPNIFPLGSQNGGGKSTLLQLIFILLKSLKRDESINYVKNLLENFDVNSLTKLATIEIQDTSIKTELNFIVYNEESLHGIYNETESFVTILNIKEETQKELLELEEKLKKLDKIYFDDHDEHEIFLKKMTEITKEIEHKKYLVEIAKKQEGSIQNKFISEGMMFVTNYIKNHQPHFLFCQFSGDLQTKALAKIIQDLPQKIFLATPSTQSTIFLNSDHKKLLFQGKVGQYQLGLEKIKKNLYGFFTYDFLSISLIIDFFNKVFDLDIRKAIKTKGDYDNQYKKLIEEFNKVLTNKSLNITPDRTGVTFEMEDEDGNVRELYPEDLSHGELKRLSIYLWLKYYEIQDSIVLMDEIEIAFHPDWQYQIIRDLQEWGPSNQYILATHSYELCEALTPAHVKEINPHLLPSQEHEPQP